MSGQIKRVLIRMNRIDKYEIIEQIGRGGMGAVYKAIHPQFKKYVAIKEIRSDLASIPEIQHRFEQEVELLAQLPPHPNIVTIRDALVWQGRLYIVMDFVDGATLSELLHRGGVSPDRAAMLLDQILSGLEAIHRRGIVHRDLKAGNILLDREGTAYISDFGIAEIAGSGLHSEMATAKCAAPESIDPSLGRQGSARQVDIYAAGMLAYEMLLGDSLFREAFPEVYNGTPGGEPARWLVWHTNPARRAPNLRDIIPSIPGPLAGVVERMMAKDVKERYQDAAEARRDLAAGLYGANDARNRRNDPPDDRTMPLDRLRGAGGAPSPPQPYPPQYPPPQYAPPYSGQEPPSYHQQGRQPVTPVPPRRRIPGWIWAAAGGFIFLVIVGIVLYTLIGNPGFTLIVRGAPPGSDIYVDNIRRGVTSADGSIRISELKAGTRLLRVSKEGFTDFNDRVTGKDGETKSVIAQLVATDVKPSVQNQIDYNGPMILIPAGEFIMGDDSHLPNEAPSHKVNLPDYYIDKLEVTNAQYRKFCEATGRPMPTRVPWNANYFNSNPESPVIGISWDDAASYAQWAGKRLPTEEEWEKAASWDPNAQKKHQWPWGDSPDPSRANINQPQPTAVGQHPTGVSFYGVHDMCGNAAEWVDSYYQPYAGNQTPDENFGTRLRIVRGGSFRGPAQETRTTYREAHPPELKADLVVEPSRRREILTSIGFRCAVSANDPKLQEYLRSH